MGTHTAHFFCSGVLGKCCGFVEVWNSHSTSFMAQCLGLQGIVEEVFEFCSSSVVCKLLHCNSFESRRLHHQRSLNVKLFKQLRPSSIAVAKSLHVSRRHHQGYSSGDLRCTPPDQAISGYSAHSHVDGRSSSVVLNISNSDGSLPFGCYVILLNDGEDLILRRKILVID